MLSLPFIREYSGLVRTAIADKGVALDLDALLALDVSGAYGAYLVFVLVATGVIYFVGKRLKMPRGERLDRGGFHFKR